MKLTVFTSIIRSGLTNKAVSLDPSVMSMEAVREQYARFRREILVYKLALRDPRTPKPAKWFLGAAIAYALTPIDLIPDFIPVIGHLDDAVIIPALVWLAVRLIPRDVIEECRAEVARSLGFERASS